MTFRQNEYFVKELIFFCVLMTLLALGMIIVADHWIIWVCGILFPLLVLYILRTEPWITMDGQGVRCFTKKEVLWDYPWEEIAEIRRTTYMRTRAMQLVPVEERKREEPQNGYRNLSIQLTKTSRQALNTYCPGLRK